MSIDLLSKSFSTYMVFFDTLLVPVGIELELAGVGSCLPLACQKIYTYEKRPVKEAYLYKKRPVCMKRGAESEGLWW